MPLLSSCSDCTPTTLSPTFSKLSIGGCCRFRRWPKPMRLMRFAVLTGPRGFVETKETFSNRPLRARHWKRFGRTMASDHFAAQYQQNPQPPEGNVVKREWLKFYAPDERPRVFDIVLQSWDTAVKDTELANFSVCTTWGIKDQQSLSARRVSTKAVISRHQEICRKFG